MKLKAGPFTGHCKVSGRRIVPRLMKAQQELEIARVWRVSTGHITEDDSRVLSQIADDLVVYEYVEGFMLVVPAEDELDTDELIKRGLSPAVGHILSVATGHAVEYVMIDRDAPVYDFLPQYHW